MRIVLTILPMIMALITSSASFAQGDDSSSWDRWRFLLGDWLGEGGDGSNQGTGGSTFKFDLQRRIIVRTNWAAYPATKNRPASRHDDLMVIYREAGSAEKAIYWDNEGHVIRYNVEFPEEGEKVVFTSDSLAPGPRFRLTYVRETGDRVTIAFDIAPTGISGAFTPYIVAHARRH